MLIPKDIAFIKYKAMLTRAQGYKQNHIQKGLINEIQRELCSGPLIDRQRIENLIQMFHQERTY